MSGEVYITGVGLITALGIGKEENWRKACEGRSGVGLIKRFDASDFYTRFGGEIPDGFDALFAERFPKRVGRHTALFTQLCLASTAFALEDGGLNLEDEDREEIGVSIGTGAGGLSYWESKFMNSGYRESLRALESLAIIKYMSNAAAAMTSLYYGLEGPSVGIALSCASGAQSICQAYDWIKLGRVQMAIAGGAEAVLCRAMLSSFNKLQALSERNSAPEKASRPFDRERDGFVLGDGAGVLILESAEHCRKRDGRPYARICGYGATTEAHHMMHPAENGTKMARTMVRALRDASMAPEAVDYINAHGTSTKLNDQCETAAIKQVFSEHARELSVGSTKSMIGHTIGAAGAIELAITALSVANDVVTPTINYEYPDEECDLDYTPNVARPRPVRVALSNSFGFGGHNCSIVLAKP